MSRVTHSGYDPEPGAATSIAKPPTCIHVSSDFLMLKRTALVLAALVLAACGSETSTAPAPGPTVTIVANTSEVYASDVIDFDAVVRDASGAEIPGAAVEWSVSAPARAELAANGVVTFLFSGNVAITARYGSASASRAVNVKDLPVQLVTVTPSPLVLARGDIALLGVRITGPGGRIVTGRVATITSDNPAVATIDAAGRVRAVSPGATTVRVKADGVTGTTSVQVNAEDVQLTLSRYNGRQLPALDATDTVTWDGVREYHEVYAEGGQLRYTGGTAPRYEVDIRYAEYNVYTNAAGRRIYELRRTWREFDRGLVQYDGRGDLLMTSEYIWPLQHTAIAGTDGFNVRFRVPGDNQYLDLKYRREF